MNSTHAQLEKYRASVPSLFATAPSPKMSDRYAFISTADLLAPLVAKGAYEISAASQRNTRRGGRNPLFTRHMVRVRPANVKVQVGDVIPEAVITNSHDGQSRVQAYGGLFRLVCANGLVVGIPGAHGRASFIHLGDPSKIIEQIKEAINIGIKAGDSVKKMMKTTLSEKDQFKFARVAAGIAYGSDEAKKFEPSQLLAARRKEDEGNNLWVVFNRLQENIIRGGVKFVSSESNRSFQTRGLTHIGRTIDFNSELWTEATKLAA